MDDRKKAIEDLPEDKRNEIRSSFLEVSEYSGTHDEKGYSLRINAENNFGSQLSTGQDR